jgi:hypothetical protein
MHSVSGAVILSKCVHGCFDMMCLVKTNEPVQPIDPLGDTLPDQVTSQVCQQRCRGGVLQGCLTATRSKCWITPGAATSCMHRRISSAPGTWVYPDAWVSKKQAQSVKGVQKGWRMSRSAPTGVE